MDKHRIDELGMNYVEKYSLYEEYSARIRNLVQDLVDREDIEPCGVEGWAKAPSELVKSLGANYEGDASSFAADDLVTVRVLVRFPEDVQVVEEVIRSEFKINAERSTTSEGLEDPYRFGYPSVFYVLSLSDSRSELKEWRKYDGLSFTLELRTVLQDAWATISPRVNLSVDAVSEKKLKRKLIRLAALLEEADEGFLALWGDVKNASVPVPPRAEVRIEETEAPVQAEKIFSEEEFHDYMQEQKGGGFINKWNATTIKAGFPIFVPTPNYLKESCIYLYKILRAVGIDTASELEKFLAEMDEGDKGLLQLKAVQGAFEKESGSWRVDAFSAVFLLVMNLKWDILKNKDLVALGIKGGSDRISGIEIQKV
ncbi:hypothetical protein FACS1894204_07300 [Synergistales bacterium]|nr:hypothetical protein FACS1894204_07300 [Synergistales bacterium]